jgi:hypothetical protein
MYWPAEGSQQFGNINVEIVQEENGNFVTTRRFLLTHESVSLPKTVLVFFIRSLSPKTSGVNQALKKTQ